MSDIVNVSRRDFLRTGLLAGGGLVLGLHLPSLAAGKKDGPFALNAFVRVGADESVTVLVNHSEMGQGPYTSVPMMVAEELDADWARVRVEQAGVDQAFANPIFGMQATGGSTSGAISSRSGSAKSMISAGTRYACRSSSISSSAPSSKYGSSSSQRR